MAHATRNTNERMADALVRQQNFTDLPTLFLGQGTYDQMNNQLAAGAINPPPPPNNGSN